MDAEQRSEGRRRRTLIERIRALVCSGDLDAFLAEIRTLDPRRTVRTLLRFLSHEDEAVRMRAALAVGLQVARLADQDIGAAREIVRRLVWAMNEESGSSWWGAAEAMAEIMVNHEGLAKEYAHLLIHYLEPGRGLVSQIPFQRSVLHGLARCAARWPHLLGGRNACRSLQRYLGSEDPAVRGLAVRCVGLICEDPGKDIVLPLLDDEGEFSLYRDGQWERVRVGELAREAWEALSQKGRGAAHRSS
jgi:hypothetical protein